MLPVTYFVNIEDTMPEALHDHLTSISTGGRSVCNLRFADIDLMPDTNVELQDLTKDRSTNAVVTVVGHQDRLM